MLQRIQGALLAVVFIGAGCATASRMERMHWFPHWELILGGSVVVVGLMMLAIHVRLGRQKQFQPEQAEDVIVSQIETTARESAIRVLAMSAAQDKIKEFSQTLLLLRACQAIIPNPRRLEPTAHLLEKGLRLAQLDDLIARGCEAKSSGDRKKAIALLMEAAFLVRNYGWEPNDLDKRESILLSELTALGSPENGAATTEHPR